MSELTSKELLERLRLRIHTLHVASGDEGKYVPWSAIAEVFGCDCDESSAGIHSFACPSLEPPVDDRIVPIVIGVGKVRVAICWSEDDPQQVKRELVIYDDGGGQKPVGTDEPEHRGKKVPDVGRILARLHIADADGAAVFLRDLQTVIENARQADSALTKEV